MIPNESKPIQKRLMEYVRKNYETDAKHYRVTKLIGDVSMRQYFRYSSDNEKPCILAVYPEPFDPNCFNYKEIYDLFDSIGIPVPKILDIDGSLGIVLQQDLGTVTLQDHLITADGSERNQRIHEAIDHIVTIQHQGSQRINSNHQAAGLFFDRKKLNWEFTFFRKHYLHNYRKFNEDNFPGLEEEFDRISDELSTMPQVLCHRDYHVRNLMLFQDKLYVIDFQDARWGPTTYDLASLLKDSCNLSVSETDGHIDYFLEKSNLEKPQNLFKKQFHLTVVQRLLKALGTFAYQVFVRENFLYEQYMAGSLKQTLLSLDFLEEFPSIRNMIEREISNS